jgi:hypothetical protein
LEICYLLVIGGILRNPFAARALSTRAETASNWPFFPGSVLTEEFVSLTQAIQLTRKSLTCAEPGTKFQIT